MKYRDPDISADDLYLMEIEREIVESQRKWKNEERPISFLAFAIAMLFSAGMVGTVTFFLLRWFR